VLGFGAYFACTGLVSLHFQVLGFMIQGLGCVVEGFVERVQWIN
jgi:hypothetical protein